MVRAHLRDGPDQFAPSLGRWALNASGERNQQYTHYKDSGEADESAEEEEGEEERDLQSAEGRRLLPYERVVILRPSTLVVSGDGHGGQAAIHQKELMSGPPVFKILLTFLPIPCLGHSKSFQREKRCEVGCGRGCGGTVCRPELRTHLLARSREMHVTRPALRLSIAVMISHREAGGSQVACHTASL